MAPLTKLFISKPNMLIYARQCKVYPCIPSPYSQTTSKVTMQYRRSAGLITSAKVQYNILMDTIKTKTTSTGWGWGWGGGGAGDVVGLVVVGGNCR